MRERAHELYRDQPPWRIRRADLAHDDRRLVRDDRLAPSRQPVRPAAIRLASGPLRVRRVHRRSLELDTVRRAEMVMTMTEVTAKRSNSADEPDAIRLPQPAAREPVA